MTQWQNRMLTDKIPVSRIVHASGPYAPKTLCSHKILKMTENEKLVRILLKYGSSVTGGRHTSLV